MIHFRGVPEPKDDRGSKNLHYALDAQFAANVQGFLEWCAVDQRAAFFLPGTVRGQGTGKADVLSLPAILIDFDKGDPDANLADVERLIGPATIVVESGGRTETGAKLHAYWRLAEPATLADITLACRLREVLANRYGGDPAFKQPAQVIRIPGSVHFKGAPKLVQLRTVRPEATYQLASLAAAIEPTAPKAKAPDNFFDFGGVAAPSNDMDRVLTEPVHEGAVDDMTRFEAAGKAIGHYIRMVREGRMSPEDAWVAVVQWNQANMVPPWSEDRLRNDFERLVRLDVQSRGPLVQSAPTIPETAPEGWSITDWRADIFSGPAPERRWLIEGLVPLGTAGVFAAVGDAGKSMMALQLALHVSTEPVVQSTTGLDFLSPHFFGQPVVGRGAAVILTAEDDAAEVHRRLNSLDPSHARRDAPLYVVPMLATGGARSILSDTVSGPQPTPFWDELRAQLLSIPDLRLVVLDPLSSFVGGDTNDNALGSKLMMLLGELATKSGAAVMLIHHFAKGTVPTDLTDARTAIRGASALVDNGRWALTIWEADGDRAYNVLKNLDQKERAKQSGVVYLGGLAKGNAPGSKTMRTLVRAAKTGLLEDVTELLAANAPKADEIDERVHRALCDYKQERPKWNFPLGKNSIGPALGPALAAVGLDVSDRILYACAKRLLERGLIEETDRPGKFIPVYPED